MTIPYYWGALRHLDFEPISFCLRRRLLGAGLLRSFFLAAFFGAALRPDFFAALGAASTPSSAAPAFLLGAASARSRSLKALSVDGDLGDLHGGERLPVSLQLLVLLLALVVEDQNLCRHDLRLAPGPSLARRRACATCPSSDETARTSLNSNLVVLDRRQFLDPNHIAGCDAILLSPGADDRVHNSSKTGHTSTATSLKITLALHRARTAAAVPIGIPRLHSQQVDYDGTWQYRQT